MQVLAVALGQAVYLWNAATGSIQHLLTLSAVDDFVTRYASMVVSNGHEDHSTSQFWKDILSYIKRQV